MTAKQMKQLRGIITADAHTCASAQTSVANIKFGDLDVDVFAYDTKASTVKRVQQLAQLLSNAPLVMALALQLKQ